MFDEFVLPHLTRGRRGPAPRLPLCKIFNYILKVNWLQVSIVSGMVQPMGGANG